MSFSSHTCTKFISIVDQPKFLLCAGLLSSLQLQEYTSGINHFLYVCVCCQADHIFIGVVKAKYYGSGSWFGEKK